MTMFAGWESHPRIVEAERKQAAERASRAGALGTGPALAARLAVELPGVPKAKRSGHHASKLEQRRAEYHEQRKRDGLIAAVIQQPRFYLPGGVRYTADSLVIGVEEFGGGHLLTVEEVKGSRLSVNARDSITRFRIAAALNRWATWKLVEWKSGGWVEEIAA